MDNPIRYSVRIKLTDFIGTEVEDEIVTYIADVARETGKRIFLKLWYKNGELTQSQVADFVKKYETILTDIGTNIHVGDIEPWQQKSWFNIKRRGESTQMEYRHEHIYVDVDGIFLGLHVFKKMVIGVEKPPKPQPPPNIILRDNEEVGKPNGKGYRVSIRRVNDNVQNQVSKE